MPFEWEQTVKQPGQAVVEALQVHQLTREFHQEIEYRDEFAQYCSWYYQTAARHRQETGNNAKGH